MADALFIARHGQVIALAARHALPAIYPLREHAAAGGLMSYGAGLTDTYRQAAAYTARVLGADSAKLSALPRPSGRPNRS